MREELKFLPRHILIPTRISNSQPFKFRGKALPYPFAFQAYLLVTHFIARTHLCELAKYRMPSLRQVSQVPSQPSLGAQATPSVIASALWSPHTGGQTDAAGLTFHRRVTLWVVIYNFPGVLSSRRNVMGHVAHPKFLDWFVFRMLLSLGGF